MGWADAPEVQQASAPAGWMAAPEVTEPKKPGPSLVESAADVVRSIPGGVVKGASALAGLPGDVEHGLTFLADKALGVKADERAKMDAARAATGGVPTPPTSGQIANAVSQPFGGFYKPKYLPGQVAETVASFAPNAIAPGSLPARAARVLVPGVASEAAGQAVKGTKYEKYEPLARAAGALMGGAAQGVAEGMLNRPKIMSMDELKTAKNATYRAAEQQNVTISPQSWQSFANDVKTEMAKKPFRPDLHANAVSALDTIASQKGPVSLEEADSIRQVLNDAITNAGSTNGGDLGRATKIKGMLDDYLDNLTPQDTLSGNASVAVPILKDARSLAQREFKAKEIQKLIDLADNQASTNYSASGYEQALRAQFKNFNAKLIKDPQLAKSFSAPERAAIAQVAKGGPIGNALRWMGKFSPNGSVQTNMASGLGLTTGGGLGYVLSGGNPMVAAGAGLAGQTAALSGGAAARAGATAITARNARLAEELMRAGQPINPGATALPQQLIMGALLSQGALNPKH